MATTGGGRRDDGGGDGDDTDAAVAAAAGAAAAGTAATGETVSSDDGGSRKRKAALPLEEEFRLFKMQREAEISEIRELKRKDEVLEGKVEASQQKFDNFKTNMQMMIFYPAVLFSLLETAISLILAKFGFPRDHTFSSSCSTFARTVLAKLLMSGNDRRNGDFDQALSRARRSVNVPRGQATGLTKCIHKALVVFLELLIADHFAHWFPDRNPPMHNGRFLEALHSEGPANPNNPYIDEVTLDEVVYDMRQKLTHIEKDTSLSDEEKRRINASSLSDEEKTRIDLVDAGCQESQVMIKRTMRDDKHLPFHPSVGWEAISLSGSHR